jgi:hypothetical protein
MRPREGFQKPLEVSGGGRLMSDGDDGVTNISTAFLGLFRECTLHLLPGVESFA